MVDHSRAADIDRAFAATYALVRQRMAEILAEDEVRSAEAWFRGCRERGPVQVTIAQIYGLKESVV
jgi:hypothetical protein